MKSKKQKILIVEDDPAVLDALKWKLGREKFDLITAVNGEEGLAKALAEDPDLLLLDLILPKMDGITMLKKLRSEIAGKNVKALVLTAATYDKENVELARALGVLDYMIKANWKIKDIVERVKEVLKY